LSEGENNLASSLGHRTGQSLVPPAAPDPSLAPTPQSLPRALAGTLLSATPCLHPTVTSTQQATAAAVHAARLRSACRPAAPRPSPFADAAICCHAAMLPRHAPMSAAASLWPNANCRPIVPSPSTCAVTPAKRRILAECGVSPRPHIAGRSHRYAAAAASHRTAGQSTTQHSTAQHDTTQHSTTQHSTA
jgi:hypothetical protein